MVRWLRECAKKHRGTAIGGDPHIYIYIYMYVCMHVCMYVCMYTYMYVYIYVCMCVYICIPVFFIYTYLLILILEV